MGTDLKMKLFALLALALVAEAGKNKGNDKNERKGMRKDFRKCKRQNCSDRCDKGQQQQDCYDCLESQCQVI